MLDPSGIPISTAANNQSGPTIAFDVTNWLVAWMTERESNRFYNDVMAARVAPDGTVLDPTPILVNAAHTSADAYLPWAVAGDGTNWVIV